MVMATLTRRSIRARWVRFALCSLSVVLGVAFVTGSFVLSDSLRRVFDNLATTFTSDTDVTVRSVDPFASSDSVDAPREPLPESMVATVAGVDGVARADGSISGDVTALTPSGELIDAGEAPVLAISWTTGDGSDSDIFTLLDGTAPHGTEEVAIDQAAAKRYDLHPGDQITVRAATTATYTVSGTFSVADGGAGAYFLTFDLPTTQAIFDMAGQVQSIEVRAADGVSQTELRDRVASVLPSGVEAITGQQSQEEFAASFDGAISILRTVLLVFAFITLFVAAFLINTVFNTTVGQRVRELALLRAIGARNSQVRRSVLFESLAIGVVGSVLGALAGVGVAALLKSLFSSSGAGLPDGPLVLSPTTWIVALLVGVGITMIVSMVPAWRAGKVPPVAAMRDGYSPFAGRAVVRIALAVLTTAAGLGAFLYALLADFDKVAPRMSMLGLGALAIFLGVAGLAPLFTRAVSTAVGAPFGRLFGVTGRLAQGNAARNPRRTSSTAAALMIGVTLVSAVGVMASSFKSSFSQQLDEGIAADYLFTAKTNGFSPDFAEQVAAVPGVDAINTFRGGTVKVDGQSKSILATQATGLDRTLHLKVIEGEVAQIPDDGMLVGIDPAKDMGLSVGDTVDVLFPVGGERQLRVAGIYDDPVGLTNWMINDHVYEAGFPQADQLDLFGGVTLAEGADHSAVAASLDQLITGYPEIELEDRAEFKASQSGQIDQLSVIINGLLGMSLVVAVLGIAITLSLAVFERTRELGLLRAVGQQRRQTRRMVRLEAVIIALFGAGLGVGLGLLFGLAMAGALPERVMPVVQVPYAQLVGTLVIAAVAGVGAALLPAWRASRLKVLEAIAYE